MKPKKKKEKKKEQLKKKKEKKIVLNNDLAKLRANYYELTGYLITNPYLILFVLKNYCKLARPNFRTNETNYCVEETYHNCCVLTQSALVLVCSCTIRVHALHAFS